MNIIKILTLASLTGTALLGGVFYAFSTAIMGSLQRMPTGQGAAAMNLISARIQNPLFLLIFIGTALVSLALAVLAFGKDSPGAARVGVTGRKVAVCDGGYCEVISATIGD
jgi:uncharacterized membrane protein